MLDVLRIWWIIDLFIELKESPNHSLIKVQFVISIHGEDFCLVSRAFWTSAIVTAQRKTGVQALVLYYHFFLTT